VAQAGCSSRHAGLRLGPSPPGRPGAAPGCCFYRQSNLNPMPRRLLHGSEDQAQAEWLWRHTEAAVPAVLGCMKRRSRLWQRLAPVCSIAIRAACSITANRIGVAPAGLPSGRGKREREVQALPRRMIDLHKRCAVIWLMQVSSYGLKAVATGWASAGARQAGRGPAAALGGGQWRGDGSDAGRGSLTTCWRILRYNRGTTAGHLAVATWLLTQDPAVAALPAHHGGALDAGWKEI